MNYLTETKKKKIRKEVNRTLKWINANEKEAKRKKVILKRIKKMVR